jgi:nucleosome binding factor SPN SPT16 subunit
MTSSIVDASLYRALKVPREVYEKTMKTYMSDKNKASQIHSEISDIRKKVNTREVRELTRDECITAKKLIEKNKLEVQQKIF